MTDRRGFAEWEGKAVQVYYTGGKTPADYGVLEEVNDWGLMLRLSSRRISWPGEVEGGSYEDHRDVSEFRPWHMVSRVRVLEPEEKEGHGL
jgi:hypothetical protein